MGVDVVVLVRRDRSVASPLAWVWLFGCRGGEAPPPQVWRWANDIRQRLEDAADDLAAHFEGGICGDDENGNWIIGYGVGGSPDHVEFGDAISAPLMG